MDVAAFVISIVALCGTIFGLWLSWRSTRASELSAKSADRSAKVAERSLLTAKRSNSTSAGMLEIEKKRFDYETSRAQKEERVQQVELSPELELAFAKTGAIGGYATQSVRSRAAYASLFGSSRTPLRYRSVRLSEQGTDY